MLYLCRMCKLVCILLLFFSASSYAQFDHQSIFPNEEGDALYQLLISNFKAEISLDYGDARDTLFRNIDSVNDTVYGVYSHFGKYLDPNEDPTMFLFEDGGPFTINTEHTYPQSKGASQGPARSDMHHLFPTRTPVNSARGSDPFGEIDDNLTERWFYLGEEQSQVPNQNIDNFSEYVPGTFEPREDHKGNVARAMFYFYTMYRNEANNADPLYFENQKETLCDWHYLDPVDEQEWNRTHQIATYQDDKVNPFVLDCSLAARLYCEKDAGCRLVNTNEEHLGDRIWLVYDDVLNDIWVHSTRDKSINAFISILDLSGRQLYGKNFHILNGKNKLKVIDKLNSGIYILSVFEQDHIVTTQKIIIK